MAAHRMLGVSNHLLRHVRCSFPRYPTFELPDMSTSVNEGFDRLQELLLAMRIGDEVRPGDASDETGLSPELCLAVLVGLERAGLMARRGNDRFVRRTLEFDA